MLAFLSYQTDEKAIAGHVAKILNDMGVATFTAHDDIEVSREWREELLKQIATADLFVPLPKVRKQLKDTLARYCVKITYRKQDA